MKYLGETSLKKLISLVKGDIAAKQNKITEVGILKGRGDGTVSATSPLILNSGTDYGESLPTSPAINQLFFQTINSNFVLDNVYPVGSIYMNVNSTNPGTLFGGTWEQIQGKFLLGMSSSYPAGSTGGEESHRLTASEMPSHNGHLSAGIAGITPYEKGNYKGYLDSSTMTAHGDIGRGWNVYSGNEMHPASEAAGGGQPHNNMPPYLSVYIWKRTS